jgi:hypothetical protein
MVLANVTNFGLAVMATVLSVEVKIEDRHHNDKKIFWDLAHVHAFRFVILVTKSSIRVRLKAPYTEHNLAQILSADNPSANVTTPSDSVARRATFDNLRLAAEQGFTPIIARTEFQNRGSVRERYVNSSCF